MVDSVLIDPGDTPSVNVATDDVAGIGHVQKMKLLDPTPDSAAGIGIASNPLRTDPTGTTTQPISGTVAVSGISGSIALPSGASTLAEQQVQTTSLQLLDDTVLTDGATAGTKLLQVGGTDGTNAQIMSTNASGHVNIADGGNSITVDGTIAATQSGTWDIGTVTTITNVVHVDDNAGSLTVDDGGGSLTVDGTVAATQSGTWNIGTVTPGTGASNLGKAEEATHTSGDVGVMALAVRNDNLGTLTPGGDGRYSPIAVGPAGQQIVAVTATGQPNTQNGLLKAEDAGHSTGDVGVMILGVRNDSLAVRSDTDSDYTPISVSNRGNQYVELVSGNTSALKVEDLAAGGGFLGFPPLGVRIDTAAATTDASGDYTQISTNSFGATLIDQNRTFQASDAHGLLKAEDAASASGDAGVAVLAVRRDTLANSTTNDGDYSTVSVNSDGAVWVADQKSGTGTASSVSASASSVPLLASNTSRKGATISNDSSAILYLLEGAGTASTTNYTVKLFQDDVYELPIPIYTGAINGIWASATGAARVTEKT